MNVSNSLGENDSKSFDCAFSARYSLKIFTAWFVLRFVLTAFLFSTMVCSCSSEISANLRFGLTSASWQADMMIILILWLLVHYKVTLIWRFWLDEISHYLYWSNRNRIHVILFIDFVRKRKWNRVNTSFNKTISKLTECQVTAW